MASEVKLSRREKNKRIRKHLPRLIHENALKDAQFAKAGKIIALLMNIWIVARLVLVVDDFIVLSEMGAELSGASQQIGALVVIVLFGQAFKQGNRKLAFLPILGVFVSFAYRGMDTISIMLEYDYLPYTIYVYVFIANLVWQAFAMLYILLSGTSKAYEKEVLRLTEEAKNMDLAA